MDDGRMGVVERVQPRVSFADLERAPEDGRRYELYDGEVYVVPAPMPRHQRVQIRLIEWLDHYVQSFGGFAVCAPIDIVFFGVRRRTARRPLLRTGARASDRSRSP